MEKQQLIENIIKLDKPGREKTIQLCEKMGWKFEEPERGDLAYDCIIYINSDIFVVGEIKNRDIKCQKYDTLFLQEDKYNNVLKWKTRLGADLAWYINWIGDECYIFDLSKVDPNTKTQKWMNKVTAESTKNKELKNIYEINKKDAVIFENL